MTTQVVNICPSNSTDALFRAWGSAISAFLDSCGITKTADTGQINWTTVTAPTVSNTAQGYEVRQLTDSLQATAPIYIKIEYGSGSGGSLPGLWLTTGTATNGSGTVSGTGMARTQLNYIFQALTSATFPCWFSGGPSGFTLALFFGYSGYGTGLAAPVVTFERSRDALGNLTNFGHTVEWTFSSGYGSGAKNIIDSVGTFSGSYVYNRGGLLPQRARTANLPTTYGLVLPFARPMDYVASGPVYFERTASVPMMSTGVLIHPVVNGVTRTYKVIGNQGYGPGYIGTGAEDQYAVQAMLWE